MGKKIGKLLTAMMLCAVFLLVCTAFEKPVAAAGSTLEDELAAEDTFEGTDSEEELVSTVMEADPEDLVGTEQEAEPRQELVIKAHPETRFIKEGQTAVFKVSATGRDLSYRWEYRRANEEEWHKSTAQGHDTATLKVADVPARHNGYRYRCRIKDAYGKRVYTKTAVMYVLGIRLDPPDQYKRVGASATFHVTASGRGLEYSWQMQRPDQDAWVTPTGEDRYTDTLYIPEVKAGHNGYAFRCRVEDEAGHVVYCSSAKLYVLSISKNPSTVDIVSGGTASFSVSARGAGLHYQWEVKEPGGSWRNSTSYGCYSSTLRVSGWTDYHGYHFRCKVMDGGGNSVYSNAASLHVLGITRNPSNKTVRAGQSASFTVGATGSGLKYQWQVKPPGRSWRNSTSSGSHGRTLRVSGKAAYNGYHFRCKIRDRKGHTIYSKAASLHVKSLQIKSQPSDQVKVVGQTATFHVSASGSGLRYQWQVKEYSEGGWRNSTSSGNRTSTLKLKARENNDGFQFRCRIQDSSGKVVYTRAAYLWVNPW